MTESTTPDPATSQPPDRLPRPVPIAEQDWSPGTLPLVSVACNTYNHAPFIAQCLEGFLLQETTFPVEVIVHDDASTDGTQEILREYQARHPGLIRVIQQTENQYSQGRAVARFVLPNIRGRYVATCEGDDYWIHPAKLQTQADFLETHPDYVLCHHDSIIVQRDGTLHKPTRLPESSKRDMTPEDLYLAPPILTLARMYRNVLCEFPEEFDRTRTRDSFTTVLLADHGKARYIDLPNAAAYRRHEGGVWSSIDPQRRWLVLLEGHMLIYQYLRRTHEEALAVRFLFEALMPVLEGVYPDRNPFVRELTEARATARDLVDSRAYRLGRALLAPLRLAQ